MNHTEVTQLCRLVKALCPSQAFDQYTPDAWSIVLEPYGYEDAKTAVAAIVGAPLEPGKSRYIEPGHIIGGIGRIRAARLAAIPMPEPPDGLTPAAYLSWERATRSAIASGTYTPAGDRPAITAPERLADHVRAITGKDPQPERESAPVTPIDDEAAESARIAQMAALEAEIRNQAQTA